MLISAILTNPTSLAPNSNEGRYKRIRVRKLVASMQSKKEEACYIREYFTNTQMFCDKKSEYLTQEEAISFIKSKFITQYNSCTVSTDKKVLYANVGKTGAVKVSSKEIKKVNQGYLPKEQSKSKEESDKEEKESAPAYRHNKVKNYIIQEGIPIPYLVKLGIMNAKGEVKKTEYSKFRQINKFLETVKAVLPHLKNCRGEVKIVDFGAGAGYLTFSLYYYFNEIIKTPASVIGIELKKDRVEKANTLAKELGYSKIKFINKDIKECKLLPCDLAVFLHACDLASDYALEYAVKAGAAVILGVPCCQHEVKQALDANVKRWKKDKSLPPSYAPFLQDGIIEERFASLLTDLTRKEFLSRSGYKASISEFIDTDGSLKNLLIKGIKTNSIKESKRIEKDEESLSQVLDDLELKPYLWIKK